MIFSHGSRSIDIDEERLPKLSVIVPFYNQYDFVEEAESELDRMERAGAGRTDMLGPGDENHEKHLNDQYAERAQKRAEKRERRKFRESKRKERRKRKAERMRNEREEWIKLQQRSYFCW